MVPCMNSSNTIIVKAEFGGTYSSFDFGDKWPAIVTAANAGKRVSIKFKEGKRRRIKKATPLVYICDCGGCTNTVKFVRGAI
jgi:hypothetical protein